MRRAARASPFSMPPRRAASTSSTPPTSIRWAATARPRAAPKRSSATGSRASAQSYRLATKCVGQMGPKPWDQGMSRKHILDAIDASLKRLQTDYVDLYQLHGFDPATPIDEALEALDTVVSSGKARYVGVSNWMAHRVARALGRSEVEEPRAHRLRAAALQSALPQLRARPAAAVRGRRRRGHSLQSAGRRPAHRQARPCRAAASRARALPSAAPARCYQTRYWHEREFDTIEELRGDRQSVGHEPGHARRSLGDVEPAITAPDHRREPARATRRQSGGGRARARCPTTSRQSSTKSPLAGARSTPSARIG